MPIFDYRCAECGHTYEVFHKVREVAEDVLCPSCGSKTYRKMMSVPSLSISGKSSTSFNPGSCDNSDGGCCGGGACGL